MRRVFASRSPFCYVPNSRAFMFFPQNQCFDQWFFCLYCAGVANVDTDCESVVSFQSTLAKNFLLGSFVGSIGILLCRSG
jgi:hypothetical protein